MTIEADITRLINAWGKERTEFVKSVRRLEGLLTMSENNRAALEVENKMLAERIEELGG